ncbi:putative amidohydrolase [Saonia flava]|uniref:Omega-amidase YafV n=1 Tax=Saonia flava TaxID=523696 RepID=A0A846QWB5_9FLAO|nr:amidohydrolase [Saonia flava]NJB71230.1 putative amidohydrolase [Saonia flava]
MINRLKTALIQASLTWEDPLVNRKTFSKKILETSNDVDLIILPEMFTTGFTMSPKHIDHGEGLKTVEWMQAEASAKNAALVGSIVFQENNQFYNRLFFVKPNGEVSFYDKRHTFTLAGEDKIYTAGTSKLIVEYKGFRICPFVCYDLRFPVWARNTDFYDVLIYVANWPKPRINAWDALLKARAIENMSYCIGVNRIGKDSNGHEYNGHSAVYNTLGEELIFSEKEEVLYANLEKEHIKKTRGKLKFLDDRDEFTLLK